MKKLATLFIALIAMTFSQLSAQSVDGEPLKDLLKGIPAFETGSSYQSIAGIKTIAAQKAAKTVSITGENIKESLTEAKQYKYCIIIVEAHTIVKVLDFKNCSQSASWGICMPYGEGFIRKGGFVSSKDYINNIIGKPDAQERMMYLFN